MDSVDPSTHGQGHVDDGAPGDAALLGRDVVHVEGAHLGRIAAIVHRLDGERLAVVRRGGILPRWYFVALRGAAVVDGAVIVRARYGRGGGDPWRAVSHARG